jgi:nocturnin
MIDSRKWIRNETTNDGYSFSVLNMNILADGLDNFTSVPKKALDWEYRKTLLLKSLMHYNPDIICLQEVNHYHDFFKCILEKHGYTGKFAEKTKSPCTQFNAPKDGCAIFSKNTTFENIFHERIELPGNGQIFQKLYLSFCNKNKHIFIFNTHLKAKKQFEHIRIMQMKSIMSEIDNCQHVNPNAAIILSGDFNTRPTSKTVQMLTSETNFKSAYKNVESDPLYYTTWKIRSDGESKHIGDYIFYIGCKLIDALLPPQEIHQMRLPNMSWGSDHISQLAVFNTDF